ncbi:MAG: Na+/H+ antiporter subunit E [Ideonella sp.]|nr:Na+/H+ antiporter subunit E [Ideonella sp.]
MSPLKEPPARASDHQHPGDGGWFAHPALSVLLLLVWLLLRQSLSVPDLLAGVVLGLVVPRLAHRFLGPATHPRAPLAVARFTAVVLWDIVVSNLTVARIVLDPRSRPQPAWVPVPLDTRHPTAITLLATVITTTPGTVSCVVDDTAGLILVHALDCTDAAEMARQIKDRYEKPLMEIFG